MVSDGRPVSGSITVNVLDSSLLTSSWLMSHEGVTWYGSCSTA